MATSTVPTAKQNLISALQARAGLAGVQVVWGFPQGTPSKEMIILHKVDEQQRFPTMPGIHREEAYTISCSIDVLQQGGADATTCEQRAYQILGEVENQLRMNVGDPTLGGAVRWAEVKTATLRPGYDGQNRSAVIDVGIFCRARI